MIFKMGVKKDFASLNKAYSLSFLIFVQLGDLCGLILPSEAELECR